MSSHQKPIFTQPYKSKHYEVRGGSNWSRAPRAKLDPQEMRCWGCVGPVDGSMRFQSCTDCRCAWRSELCEFEKGVRELSLRKQGIKPPKLVFPPPGVVTNPLPARIAYKQETPRSTNQYANQYFKEPANILEAHYSDDMFKAVHEKKVRAARAAAARASASARPSTPSPPCHLRRLRILALVSISASLPAPSSARRRLLMHASAAWAHARAVQPEKGRGQRRHGQLDRRPRPLHARRQDQEPEEDPDAAGAGGVGARGAARQGKGAQDAPRPRRRLAARGRLRLAARPLRRAGTRSRNLPRSRSARGTGRTPLP